MNIKRIVNKIKKYVVKKAEVIDHYTEGESLLFEIKLSNYIFPRLKAKALLLIEEVEHELPTELVKNQLKIIIPNSSLSLIDTSSRIQVYINNKLVWITEDDDYKHSDMKETPIIGNKYLTTRVKKDIFVSRQFAEFLFSDESIDASVTSVGYNTLSLEGNFENLNYLKEMRVYAFNNRQFRILESSWEEIGQTFTLTDFSELAAGMWRLFVEFENKFHPLKLADAASEQLTSYNHRIQVLNYKSA